MDKRFFLDNSVSSIANKINENLISKIEIIELVVKNFTLNEPTSKAWSYFKKDEIDLSKTSGPLNGVPFGIKDIFNTIKMPTEMGSPIWKNYLPNNNARVVDSLISSGCIPVGKTVTAEFAVHHLNETLNPHDRKRTPGTSSSGSAAAVATGMVPFALGSQTAGSIIRPASFCGVWGMKPSFGLIPRTGVLKTTDSLDSIGFLTSQGRSLRSILDAVRVRGPNYPFVYKNIDRKLSINPKPRKKIKVGLIKTHTWKFAEQHVKDKIIRLANDISDAPNFELEEIEWPNKFEKTHQLHSVIYNKSLAYYFKNEIKLRNQVSKIMQDIFDLADAISIKQFQNALIDQEEFCEELDNLIDPYDFVISLSTGSSAPLRNEIELDDPSLIWTLGHIPSINVPIFRCPNSLPIGAQFISKKWNDYNLIKFIEDLIDLEVLPEGSLKIKSRQ